MSKRFVPLLRNPRFAVDHKRLIANRDRHHESCTLNAKHPRIRALGCTCTKGGGRLRHD